MLFRSLAQGRCRHKVKLRARSSECCESRAIARASSAYCRVWTRSRSPADSRKSNPGNVRIAGKNEAAGAADAGLCQPQIDCARSKLSRFKVCPVSENHYSIESQTGFGAIPVYELVNGMTIPSLSIGIGEAVEDCSFSELKVRQT